MIYETVDDNYLKILAFGLSFIERNNPRTDEDERFIKINYYKKKLS
jgi:hypothetical protein